MTDSPYELSTDVSMGSLYEITGKDSHRSLYVGVILQALLDLTKPKYDKEKTSVQVYRDQARAWIFKTEGVTCEDFPTGFRLGARAFDLRQLGYPIETARDYIDEKNWRARYVLHGGSDARH